MLKKGYLFLIIVICLFTISAVSAEDNSTGGIVSVSNDVNSLEANTNMNSIVNDTDTLKVSNDEVLTAGNNWYVNGSVIAKGNGSINNPFNNLSYAILKAHDNDVIYIASGTYTGEENVNLNINKHLSFVKWGDENPIFDGQNNKRIFIVNVNSINIMGLTFKNGKSDYGSAIRFTESVLNSNINACFENNTVSDNGGAIYFDNDVNNCNISGDFINNTATRNAGAIYVNGVTNDCSISGNFTNNTSPYGGAIIFHTTVNSIISGNFVNNIAAQYGGAIYFTTVTNSNISGNFTNNTSPYGGAIYFDKNVSNSNVSGFFVNNAAIHGGAINFNCVYNSNVSGCFVNNAANSGGAVFFGADGVYNSNLSGCFVNNRAIENGGAINFENRVYNSNLSGCFVNNRATENGGAINFENRVYNSNFSGYYMNNRATENGGAINFDMHVFDSNFGGFFVNNRGSHGGAINFDDSVSNSNVSGCYVNNTAGFSGGAVYFNRDVSNSNVSGCYVNNIARSSGGAIYFLHGVSNSNIDGCFKHNTAQDNGGAIRFNRDVSNSNINGCYVNNIANNRGSAIFINLFHGNTTIKDAIFINNKGNIIYVNSGNISTINCWFGNNATNYNVKPTNTENVKIDNWLFLNATANPAKINLTNTSEITFKLYSYNSTAEEIIGYDGSKMGIQLDLSKTHGTLNQTTALLNETILYTYTEKGIASVIGKFETVLNTINLNGDEPIPSINVAADNVTKYYGGSEQFIVNVTDDKGTGISGILVLITINDKTYNKTTDENGIASLNLTLPSGNYTVKTVVDNITINSLVTIISTINGDDITSELRNIIYIASLVDNKGNPLENGTTVEFNINGIIYQGHVNGDEGNATVDLILNSGNYTITATNPKTKENHSNKITINAKNITIEAKSEPITVGENATVIVSGFVGAHGSHATGTVSVTAAGKTFNGTITSFMLGGYIAEIIVTGLNETTIADVNYLGDDNFDPSNTTVEIIVNPNPDKKNLTLNATADPIAVGENATIIVTGFENATGNVTAIIEGSTSYTPIVNGTAIFTVPGLTSNTTAYIIYEGDANYNNASTAVNITVNPKPRENLTISASAEPIIVGENATVVVTGFKDATGNVTVSVKGKSYTAPIKNGEAEVIVYGLTENVTANVNYAGDDKYNPASTTVNITVNQNVIIYAPDVTKYYGGSERFTVILKDLNANPIADADINITVNGKTYTKTTDKNGETSIAINLNSGVYNVTTEYNGTKVYSTVTVKDTVTAKDVTKIFKNGTQYQATFVDSKGNLVKNTDIEININGVFYTRTTDANGMAQLNINLPPGTYILTAINPSNGEMHTTNVTVLSNIVENYDLTKYYRNASQYSLRLLDDKGNPVDAGVSIQLNINGVLYTRTSDENGYVRMNINLPPGTYIVTAEYKGLKASNTINVLTVLETEDLVMNYHDGSQFKAKVLDGQGRPYAGQNVTYNINGVFYTKISDDDGIAALTINLPAGEYIITSMYNGLNVANKITIIS